jgi:hypothetical protein
MVTGRRPFDADTDAGVIAAVLSGPTPSILQHRAEAPPFLDRLIARCLEKRPEDRWPTALDLAKELEWIADKPNAAPATPARRAAPAVSRRGIEYFRSADGAVIAAARGGTGPPLFVVPWMAGTIEGCLARCSARSRLPGLRHATAIGWAGWLFGRRSWVWPTGRKSPSSAARWRLWNRTGISSLRRSPN